MGNHMNHTLINPNQLRHFGTSVQDNPASLHPLSIIKEDREFCMELSMDGTIVFVETHTPTQQDFDTCPKIELLSPHAWNPKQVKLPSSKFSLEEEVGGMRYLSGISTLRNNDLFLNDEDDDVFNTFFSLENINRGVASLNKVISEETSEKTNSPLIRDESIDPGKSDVPLMKSFQSTERHTDVSPESLSERWNINIATAINTLKRTTQKFLRSAVLPLSRRYRADRVFYRKTLSGKWSTDTMDGRVKSLAGNRYAQVFANYAYFARIYPMDSKKKAGDALRLFCQEFGIPEDLTFDGSKEQNMKGTSFMHQVRTHNINYHVSEPGHHNQNPVEGVIRELRSKWYRIIIQKRVPEKMWDYGLQWVS